MTVAIWLTSLKYFFLGLYRKNLQICSLYTNQQCFQGEDTIIPTCPFPKYRLEPLIIPIYLFPEYRLEPTEAVSLGVPAGAGQHLCSVPLRNCRHRAQASGACSKSHRRLTAGGEISKLAHHTMEPALFSETRTQAPGEQATVLHLLPCF